MSQFKSWADHCSSDEESLDDHDDVADEDSQQHPGEIEPQGHAPSPPPPEHHDHDHHDEPPQQHHQEERVYEFPDKPPFTAFIGNLSYGIKDTEQLKVAIADLTHERLNENIHVLGCRIAFDRNGGDRHRGFGYIEVETLDEVRFP